MFSEIFLRVRFSCTDEVTQVTRYLRDRKQWYCGQCYKEPLLYFTGNLDVHYN